MSLIGQNFLKLLTPKNMLIKAHNRACFWKSFGSERVNKSQKLLKSAEKYLYPNLSFYELNWVRKSYFQSGLKFQHCLLTGWLPTRSILVVIERIYRCQLKWNYLRNHKSFLDFFFNFGICIKFTMFGKKHEPHTSSIFEIIDSEKCSYLNA